MSDPASPGVAAELALLGPRTPLSFIANMFKIPTLWGVKNTAPYFHDNSAKDLDEVLKHYNKFFETLGLGQNALTPQNIEDIKAFLNLL
jgi:cytochrome c peroxidase